VSLPILKNRPVAIDKSNVDDHYYLTVPPDECIYFGEYTSGQGFSGSKTNKLISNFKKPMSRKGLQDWHYKLQAINISGALFRNAAELIIQVNSKDGISANDTLFIPIPPSRARTDAEYDPRILQALQRASSRIHGGIHISDCIDQYQNTVASHTTSSPRLSPRERADLYTMNTSLIPPTAKVAIIVDDIITTGSHFKAVEIKVKEVIPHIRVAGLFIARRVIPRAVEFNFEDHFSSK